MQTRHSDRISTLNAALFRLAVETVLSGILAGFSSAFLAVRRQEPDRQSGLVHQIGHTAQITALFQMAKVRVLPAERRQSLFQSGIVGVNARRVLGLVELDNCFLFVLRQLHPSSLLSLGTYFLPKW